MYYFVYNNIKLNSAQVSKTKRLEPLPKRISKSYFIKMNTNFLICSDHILFPYPTFF